MSDKPTKINGGCLCGSIRYSVVFPDDHDWDNRIVGTCQCSWCRKVTGSLMFRWHRIPIANLTWLSDSSLATHSAVEGRERGFCRNCGSFLFYRRKSGVDWINLAVGCFDKDALAEHGTILTQETANLWCCNEIPGVTDHLRGDKYDKE